LGSIANIEADSSDSEGEGAADSDEGEDEENFISLKSSEDADDESNEGSDDESVDYEDVSSGAEEEVEEDSDDSDFVNDKSGEEYNSSGDDDEEEEETVKPVEVKKKMEKLPKSGKKNKASTSKESPALAAMNQELGNSAPKDEFADGDTSDEEDIRNTVGNIPMHWYDEYKHIGYDWDGKKIIKPPVKDAIDNFLDQMDDPNFWRTVKDPQTGQEVVLTPEDIMSQRNPDSKFEEYAVSW
jgi:ribosome biogenesis protein ERB1